MSSKRIIILGGGFGGVSAALAARSLLSTDHEIVLIDRNRRTYLCGSLPMLIVGERESAKISRSLGLLANRGIRYVQSEVESIDIPSRIISTSDANKMEYDYLIVATGASYDWDAVPGSSGAYSFYDLPSARRLRRKLNHFRRGKLIIAVSNLPYKCPPAPYEMAMILDWHLTRAGVRNNISIHLHTPEAAPLPIAGPHATSRLKHDLDKRGIYLHTGSAITAVSKNGREASFSDGTHEDADIISTIPTHRVPTLVSQAGLSDKSSWVEVSPKSLETCHSGVYAIGDVNMISMSNGGLLPKAGVFASSEGLVAGRKIATAVNGSDPTEDFSGVGHCFVAYSGTRAGIIKGRFLAPDKPDVKFYPPTTRGYQTKESFERNWRRFHI